MADAPKKPTEAGGEKHSPADVEAAGAKKKLEADSKPDTPAASTPAAAADKPAGTDKDKPAEPGAAPASGTPAADKPAGEKAGAEKTDKPGEEHHEDTASWLYEQTFGRVDTLAEVKGLFGFGKHATAADKEILAAVQVHDPLAKAKLGADGKPVGADGKPIGADGKPLPADAPPALTLDGTIKPGDLGKSAGLKAGDGNGNLFDPSSWNWRTFTPDFAESTLASIGTAIKDTASDWLADWYDSSQEMLPNLDAAKQNAKAFSTATEDHILTQGSSVTKEQADQTLNSKLPEGVSADHVRDLLSFGLDGDKVDYTYNFTDGTSKEFDPETKARRIVNEDGSASLYLPGADGKGTGLRVNEDVNGNVTWMFSDGVLREGGDGSFTSSFGDWQKLQVAASKEISSGLRKLVSISERDDDKSRGTTVDAAKADDGITREMLAGKTFDGQPLTAEKVRELLKSGLPGADTQTLTTKGYEGSKVQEINGVQRIESPDGKTVTLQLPDGTKIVQGEKGTTWEKPNGKDALGHDKPPDVLKESADHKQFILFPGDPHSDIVQGFTNPDSAKLNLSNEQNRTVAEMITDRYNELISAGKTHDEALAEIAKQQFVGGARSEDGRRRAGFLQQIDGKWYQVNSNGEEIHLREVTKGEDGKLKLGTQFQFDKETGGWVVGNRKGRDGQPPEGVQPWTGEAPKIKVGPDGAVTVGDDSSLTLRRTGDVVVATTAAHTLTADPSKVGEESTISSKNLGEKLDTVVANTVRTVMTDNDKVVQEHAIGADGQVEGTLLRRDAETGVITTDEAIIKPNGDMTVPGLGGMQFKANGDILTADGRSIYNAGSHSWAADSGIISGGEFHGLTRTEAARIMSDASAASGKAISIGSLALSIAKSGNPNALGIMRSLAWAGISVADAGIAAAQGFAPAVISLSLSKSINFAALNVSDSQDRALARIEKFGIFDSTTQHQAMIAGSFGSTYVTPESAARHYAAKSRPELKVVA